MFDDTLDIGIVGTTAGTLWYVDWNEHTTVKMVAGHGSKVNSSFNTVDSSILLDVPPFIYIMQLLLSKRLSKNDHAHCIDMVFLMPIFSLKLYR